MANGWSSPATLVAGWGAVAATAATIIAWIVYRRQVRADEPSISAHLVICEREPRLLQMVIDAENRGGTVWVMEELICSDLAVQMTDESGVTPSDLDSAGTISFKHFTVVARRHRLPLKSMIPSGGSTVGAISRASRTVYLRPDPSSSRKKLSIRLIIASTEARQRRRAIVIKRTLTPTAVMV